MWEDFSDIVGFWADMENPYITYDNNFIESEWWALKQIWDKKLCTGALRLFRTARAVELRFPRRRWRRDIKTVRGSVPLWFVSKVVGRGCLLPRMDHDAVDTSVKRGTLREPGGYLLEGKGSRRLYLLYGGGTAR